MPETGELVPAVRAREPASRLARLAIGSALLAVAACAGGGDDDGAGGDGLGFVRTEAREPCARHERLRQPLFGDLHVHSQLSFDAWINDIRTTADDVYRFARGEEIRLPPLDENGAPTQPLRLARPLDFAALTDHSEFLAEVEACTTPSSPAYDTSICVQYREGSILSTVAFGLAFVPAAPARFPAICDRIDCQARIEDLWGTIQQAAERAYDRSSACSFTSLIGYEWSGNTGVSNLHRNVIFRNERVPAQPTSYFEEATPQGLWAALERDCAAPGGGAGGAGSASGCDVLAIPHNSNASNGKLFRVEYPGAATADDERAQAERRAAMEPIVEVYQHKGDSECQAAGLAGALETPDPLCDFEKWQPPEAEDCGAGTGGGGISRFGCVSRVDYVRAALVAGLEEEARLGANPFALGFIAASDTHNGTPGAVDEDAYAGHVGKVESGPVERLARAIPLRPPGGIVNSPGGLAGVWAEENSRDAIFEALRRRETWGTSGPRIVVRAYGGWDLPAGLCSSPDLVRIGYERGVPMGGDLPGARPAGRAPSFVVSALRDVDLPGRPGTPLQRIQLVKGWTDAAGRGRTKVFEMAGDPANGATVDLDTCTPVGAGFDALCGVWTDPEFDASAPAYYYARVVENPTCRWSTRDCLTLPAAERPETCSDPSVPKTVQERAWTSPIWYHPR